MLSRNRGIGVCLVMLCLFPYVVSAEDRTQYGKVELLRDEWGVPIDTSLKETHFIPVVASISSGLKPGEQIAQKRIPISDRGCETIGGISSRSILPIENSENLNSPNRQATYELWAKGELHAAPITRKVVDKITVSKEALN